MAQFKLLSSLKFLYQNWNLICTKINPPKIQIMSWMHECMSLLTQHYEMQIHLNFPPITTIYLSINIIRIFSFYILHKQHVHIYNILSFAYRSIFYTPNNSKCCQFIKASDFLTFLVSICVLYLVLDIQHVFIISHQFLSRLMECFQLSKKKILCTFLFICFLDKYLLVWYDFSNQSFIEVAISYFQQCFLNLEDHFCQLHLRNCHTFQTFPNFRLIFEFIGIYFYFFGLLWVFRFLYLIKQIFSFVSLKIRWHMNGKMCVHDRNKLVRSFYYGKLYNLKTFSSNLIQSVCLLFHKHF